MSREILFKAKRVDNGEWVEGYYQKRYDEIGRERHYIFWCKSHLVWGYEEIDESTLCQFTGLLDKNGRKIFKNDVVRSGINLVVTWNEKFASWCITKKGWAYNHFFGEAVEPQDCEVLGNIFDNPERLGGEDNG